METLTVILGSTVIASVVSFVLNLITKKIEKKDSLHKAVCELLKESLRNRAMFFLDRGSISPAEMQEWEEGYALYHDKMNGNGWLKEIRSKLYALPQERKD